MKRNVIFLQAWIFSNLKFFKIVSVLSKSQAISIIINKSRVIDFRYFCSINQDVFEHLDYVHSYFFWTSFIFINLSVHISNFQVCLQRWRLETLQQIMYVRWSSVTESDFQTWKKSKMKSWFIQTKTRRRTSRLMLIDIVKAETRKQMIDHKTQMKSFNHHVLRYFRMLIKQLL